MSSVGEVEVGLLVMVGDGARVVMMSVSHSFDPFEQKLTIASINDCGTESKSMFTTQFCIVVILQSLESSLGHTCSSHLSVTLSSSNDTVFLTCNRNKKQGKDMSSDK